MKQVIRSDWRKQEALSLLTQPFNDLIFQAQQRHRQFFDPNQIQLSTLMNIKTGGCPEDCAYCPQSAHYNTGLDVEKLLDLDQVMTQAHAAKEQGASRFCMGAAWRRPTARDLDKVKRMITTVKAMGLETCVTLGSLSSQQAKDLKAVGLDFYNHNLDCSAEYYAKIITTRDYQERLDTLSHVRDAGLAVCSGGIIGMGESQEDVAGLLLVLANMPVQPESVPINMLVQVEGTPLAKCPPADPIDFVRVIAAARIMLPKAYVRLSAGRDQMSDELQALCYLAGANSIFYGEKLLTTANPQIVKDQALLGRLGLQTTSA